MIVLLIILLSLIFYYLGLSFVTTVEFKKRKIKLSFALKLFLPYYILKSYAGAIRKHHYAKKNKYEAVKDLFFGYDFALIILVEIVCFGIENELVTSKKEKKMPLLNKISKFKNKNIKNPFLTNMEERLCNA